VEAPLVEQVKAFEAVVDWAKTRKALAPPEPVKGSKIDELQRRFHGNGAPPRNRGSRAKKSSEADDLFGDERRSRNRERRSTS
jgi:hypothetical protein